MKQLSIYDPGNWLETFSLFTIGQVFSTQEDVLRNYSTCIAINDFVNPYPINTEIFDLVFWTGLENINYFRKNFKQDPARNRIISVSVTDDGICNPSACYSLASRCYTPYHKPNFQTRFLADLLPGRAISNQHKNRAWAVHEVIKRGWQDRIIMPVREIDPKLALPELADSPFWSASMPNFDDIENERFIKDFKGSIKDVTGDLFSKSSDLHMPWQMYKNSLYSVIVQDYQGILIDEKIAKPMLATRPFIVIGPQYYLKELRKLGFQTFDPIIDESYDLEPNDEIRWTKALDSLEKLSYQNPQSVHDRLKKRLQHNRKLVYNSEYWINRLKQWLNDEIYQKTGITCAIY